MCHWMVNTHESASGFQAVPHSLTSASTDSTGSCVLPHRCQPFHESPLKLEEDSYWGQRNLCSALCHAQMCKWRAGETAMVSGPLSTSQGNATGDRTHGNGNDSLSPGCTTHYLDLFGTSHFIFLSLSFLLCKMGFMFSPSELYHGKGIRFMTTQHPAGTSYLPWTWQCRYLISFSTSFLRAFVFDVCSTCILVWGDNVFAYPFPNAVRME